MREKLHKFFKNNVLPEFPERYKDSSTVLLCYVQVKLVSVNQLLK
jgi:hypothetical protein